MTEPLTLRERVPAEVTPDSLYDAFEGWADDRELTFYPAQSEALIEVMDGANVVLATPTGSGKSLVAVGAHFAALARGQRSFYTAPIKALVSEKFFALCDVFGADRVGMLTGDATVNPGAPIIAATAEVLANQALREGPGADVDLVIMDEFHFYAEPDRGWAWQVPLLELNRTQFLLMSATLGDMTRMAEDLTRRNGRRTEVVASVERPVPLHFSYVTTPIHETLEELLTTHQAPVYVVHFTQAEAVERAQALSSLAVATRVERDRIAEMIGDFRFGSGFGKTLSRLIRHGIGVHHAGMLPRYRRLVETLTQAGLLKVVCGTDTLGVGINVPIRTVVLTGLTKYDGVRTRHLRAREFHQIAGRAGRAGYDTMGTVVVQAPEHEVENARLVRKAGDDPKKLRKIQRKKPPEGFVTWTGSTFDRLMAAEPEPLTSSFRVSHSMLLNVIMRPGDPVQNLRRLLTDNHETPERQRRHVRRALAMGRALVAGGVVEAVTAEDGTRTYRLTVDLQDNFALDQPLSPLAVAAFDLLDPEDPDRHLDLVSVIEATLEDPRQVIMAQLNKAKGEAVAEMKADGIEYEERMELLEEVTAPRPLADLLDVAYETYRKGHPWVADHELRPKSVVRDVYEQAMTFTEYVSLYGLARSEGLVLRYLTDAYRALRRTVPEVHRSEEFEDLVEWLGELVRQVDSSLLEEWEELAAGGPAAVAVRPPALETEHRPVTGNERAFRVLVRNALFRRVELMARRDWAGLGALDADSGWDAATWQQALAPYFAEHEELLTDADARGPGLLIIDTESVPGEWRVRQILHDPENDHDWAILAAVSLAASDELGEAAVRVTAAGLDVQP
ncbi:MAG: DEAD/DEAH box helicase [Propionibacteriaceae bacterium]